jgi:ketosteroid isomerase-like protein
VNRADVMRWVGAYERAWREGDLDAVAELFGDDAHYRRSPYEPDDIGHAAIRAFWRDDEVFSMTARPVAIEGDTAVVRVEVTYGDPVTREYRDLWVLHFGPDGRVDDFEEWAYWPAKPYTSEV